MDRAGATHSYGGGEGDRVRGGMYGAITPAGSNRAAQRVEERGLAKGNPRQQNAPRTLRREGAPSALERIRQAARRDRTLRFTALLHHVSGTDGERVVFVAR